MSDTAVSIPPRSGLSRTLSDIAVVARRNVIKIGRVPEVLVFVLLSPIMFVLLFAYVFGNSIEIPGGSYRSMWWVFHNQHGAYAARGVHGQTIYVDGGFTSMTI